MQENFVTIPVKNADSADMFLNCCQIDGEAPVIFYLCGFASDIEGTKIQHLRQWAQNNGRGLVCFDYRGHGSSSGRVRDFAFSDWAEDSMQIFEYFIQNSANTAILVGSSMGGWMAMRLLAEPSFALFIHAALLLAPAPDFMPLLLSDKNIARIREKQIISPDPEVTAVTDDDPYVFTDKMLDDAPGAAVLSQAPIAVSCRITVLHGDCDEAVPREHALKAFDAFDSPCKKFTLIGGADHSLQRDQDLTAITDAIAALSVSRTS